MSNDHSPSPNPVRWPAPLAGLTRRLAGPASAAGFVALALGARMLLGRELPGLSIFSLFYPAILGAALLGGELSAIIALLLSLAASWSLLSQITQLTTAAAMVNLLIFLLTGAFIGVVGSRLRRLLRRRRADFARLAEREVRYRTLFEGVAEGFALLEAVWGPDGKLADLVVVEANPALLTAFRADKSIFGLRHSELYRGRDTAYFDACEQAFRGRPCRLEVPSVSHKRWFDVRLSPVGRDRIAQLSVDVTERRAAESRRTEMFDELNHRVKNNLAAVSAMLAMQARISEQPAVRDSLQKAVDRIETIGDVHASLYREGSTEEVDFGAYLRRLCDRLGVTLVDGERVRLAVEADPIMAPLDEAVALGLIVNELVTNAAKYAYPAPAGGEIRVSLRDGAAGLQLRVADDGIGLPAEGAVGGIGMRLVRSLVQQCRGELAIEPAPGAQFTVRLPRHGLAADGSAQTRLL